MMKKLFPLARSHRGQHLVEFALVLPVLLLFLMGCIVFGNVFYRILLVNEAARATARAVVVCADPADPSVTAAANAFGSITDCHIDPNPLRANTNVTVMIKNQVYITPFIAKFFPAGSGNWQVDPTTHKLNIVGSSTMLAERTIGS